MLLDHAALSLLGTCGALALKFAGLALLSRLPALERRILAFSIAGSSAQAQKPELCAADAAACTLATIASVVATIAGVVSSRASADPRIRRAACTV